MNLWIFTDLEQSNFYEYRGEQTATTLEASLTRLENTLDQLLASMEEEGEEKVVEGQGQDSQGNANGKPPQDQSKGKDEK